MRSINTNVEEYPWTTSVSGCGCAQKLVDQRRLGVVAVGGRDLLDLEGIAGELLVAERLLDLFLVLFAHVGSRQQSGQFAAHILGKILVMRLDIAQLRIGAAAKADLGPERAELFASPGIAQQALAALFEELAGHLLALVIEELDQLADFGVGEAFAVDDHVIHSMVSTILRDLSIGPLRRRGNPSSGG